MGSDGALIARGIARFRAARDLSAARDRGCRPHRSVLLTLVELKIGAWLGQAVVVHGERILEPF